MLGGSGGSGGSNECNRVAHSRSKKYPALWRPYFWNQPRSICGMVLLHAWWEDDLQTMIKWKYTYKYIFSITSALIIMNEPWNKSNKGKLMRKLKQIILGLLPLF
jgi:hypothetical protein